MGRIEQRLKVLEAHAAQTVNSRGYITLDQWRTYYETGENPEATGAHQWQEQAQARMQQAVETMAIFDEPIQGI